MINSLSLGNFKAFGPTQRVPIKPLTLIFGANSAGKSSIIHGLLLSHHAMQTDNLDAHLLNISGESVDLGGFRQYVFGRDATRLVNIGLSFPANELSDHLDTSRSMMWGAGRKSEDWKNILGIASTVGVVVNIGIKTDDFGRIVQGAAPELKAFEVTIDNDSILRFALRPDGGAKSGYLLGGHPAIEAMIKAIVSGYTLREVTEETELSSLRDYVYGLITDLRLASGNFIPIGLAERTKEKEKQFDFVAISKANRVNELKNALELHFPQLFGELLAGVRKVSENFVASLIYLGPLRSYPPRHLAFLRQHDNNWFAGGGYAWEVVKTNSVVREQVNRWLSDPSKLSTPYRLEVRNFIEAESLLQSFDVSKEGSSREEYARFVVELFREWIEEQSQLDQSGFGEAILPTLRDNLKLYVDDQFALDDVPASLPDDFLKYLTRQIDNEPDLWLVDQRTGTLVSHRDVGVGMSQVLPVLVSAYANNGKCIAIEQPEIHIHPKLQADLADVFIESALGERRNTFILETHSEHLILRLLRRIRETTNGILSDPKLALKPTDISVLYVLPDSAGSKVLEMKVTPDGDFEDDWPQGFFEERAEELF